MDEEWQDLMEAVFSLAGDFFEDNVTFWMASYLEDMDTTFKQALTTKILFSNQFDDMIINATGDEDRVTELREWYHLLIGPLEELPPMIGKNKKFDRVIAKRMKQ